MSVCVYGVRALPDIDILQRKSLISLENCIEPLLALLIYKTPNKNRPAYLRVAKEDINRLWATLDTIATISKQIILDEI